MTSSPPGTVLARPDGVGIWYERTGAAPAAGRPAVVLCPPGGRNAAYWPDELLAHWGGAASVVRLDWRGQGRSSWSTPGPTDAAALVADAVAVAAAGAPPDAPLHLVGVGLGGWVALRAGRVLAGHRRAAVAVTAVATSAWYADPRHRGPDEPTVVALVLRRRSASGADRLRLLARELRAELAPAELAHLDGSPAAREAHLATVGRWLEHGFNPDDDHRVAWLAAPPLEPAPVPGGPPLSVRVVHGAEDPVVPLAHGRRLAAAFGVPCIEVPGAGHHLGEPMTAALLDLPGVTGPA